MVYLLYFSEALLSEHSSSSKKNLQEQVSEFSVLEAQ